MATNEKAVMSEEKVPSKLTIKKEPDQGEAKKRNRTRGKVVKNDKYMYKKLINEIINYMYLELK